MWESVPVAQDYADSDLTCCGRGLMGMDVPVAQPVSAPAAILAPQNGNAVPMPLGRRVTLTPASSIRPRRTRWLWAGRLALGTLALIGGREGLGKSTLAYTLAAAITRGQLEGEFHGVPRPVAVVATEDSWAQTIVPRLIGAGADLDLIFRVGVLTELDVETGLTLPFDLDALRAQLTASGAAMLILDPLMSRLDARLDTNKDADVRIALEPIVKIAEDSGTVVAGLIHVNKSGSSDALTSLMASRAFAAVARSVVFVLADPEDENGDRKLVGMAKNNLGRSDLPMLAYVIREQIVGRDEDDGQPITTGCLQWLAHAPQGSLSMLMADAAAGPPKLTAADRAETWLTGYLRERGGRAESKQVKEAGKAAGHSERSLKRALAGAQIATENTSTVPRRTEWVLSDGSTDDGPDEAPRARARAGGFRELGPTGPRESVNGPTGRLGPAEMPAPPVGPNLTGVLGPTGATVPTGLTSGNGFAAAPAAPVGPESGKPPARVREAAGMPPEQAALIDALRAEHRMTGS
jgi:hypothetical protein